MEQQNIKLVLVGDNNVGKTCMLISYTTNIYPTEYIPTVFDNYNAKVTVDDGREIGIGLWDTYDDDSAYRFRPLTYPNTDVVLICFAVNSRKSFNSVSTKWLNEVRYYLSKKIPILLVGTKMDLRDGPATRMGYTVELGPDPVTAEEGQILATNIGAVMYLECSALTQQNLTHVFETAVRAVVSPKTVKNPPPPLPPKPQPPAVSPLPFTEARFASLINKKQFSDVTFRVQDKELYAHKVILSASSPLFQKMFVNGSTELPAVFTLIKSSVSEGDQIDQKKHEERVTIEVKDMSYEAFMVVITSCYTTLSPTPQEFSVEAVKEGLTFFQRYPRFTSDERKKFMSDLGTNVDNTNNNNTDNIALPVLADVCIELPSKKREYCHKAILAAGNDYFSKLFADSEPNDIVQLNLTDLEFSSIKRFLYTGTVNFDDKSFEYSKVVLPKLVKMNLLEYASHCACHLRDSILDTDKEHDSLYVFNTLTLAEELELRQLRAYCIWWMQVNFDTISEQEWFKNDMTLGNREEVVHDKWPGAEYHQLYDEWKAAYGKKSKKKDCLVQ